MSGKVVFVAVVAFSVSPVLAQIDSFTLTDGALIYTERNLRTGGAGAGSGDFILGGADNMFQNWWWFRAANMGAEVALSNQTFGSLSGANTVDLTYVESTGAGDLQFDFHYTLTSFNSDTRGDVDIDITVTNLSTQRIFFDIFSYTDFDLAGTFGGDSAVIGGAGNSRQLVSDGIVTGELILSLAPGGWEIGAFPTIRDKLTNGTPDVLSNSGSPFGPGDYTGAFQFGDGLDPGETFTARLSKIVEIPEPSALLALLFIAPVVLRGRAR